MLDPTLPFVFPDSRILAGSHVYRTAVPFEAALAEAAAIVGVVSGLNLDGVTWLTRLVSERSVTCRLIVVLYPACPTDTDVLSALLRLQSEVVEREERGASVEVRLLPLPAWSPAAPNALCVVPASVGGEPWLVSGSSPNFGIDRNESADLNLVFSPDPELLESWRNWFEWVWAASVQLTRASAAIPALVPAPGTAEAAQAWRDYLTLCRNARATAEEVPQFVVSVDATTGHVTLTDPSGAETPGPMDDLGVSRPDPLARRINHICRLGALVTVDKTSRVRPLDIPVKAELFGIRSFQQFGVGSRRTSYRFSILDDKDLKALESRRKAAGEMLSVFSFPLGDGVRWMPHRARVLFEQELDRLDSAGSAALKDAVGDDVKTFIAKRRERIAEAAQRLFEERQPGQRVPGSTVDEILADAERRLNQALGGRLLPKVSFSPVEFRVSHESKWTSPWGQAATLLQAIAEYPRKAVTQALFLRGLEEVDEDDLLDAMDICGDVIRKSSGRLKKRAKGDLQMLVRLEHSKLDARRRCQLLLALIDGGDAEELGASIPNEETEV